MKRTNAILKISVISQVVIAICMLSLPLTASYAKAGCCSRHGGVSGCNSATGYQLCKDGSTSPSCKCDGSSAKPAKAVKSTTTTTSTTTNTTATTAAPAAATTPAAK